MEADLDYEKLYEIRMRAGRPLFLTYDGGECFLRGRGSRPYLVTREDLQERWSMSADILFMPMRTKYGRDI